MTKNDKVELPRFLYKTGGKFKWGKDKTYSSILVSDEAEYDSAIKSGYIDDFSAAVFGKEAEVSKDVDLDDDF